MSGQPVLIRWMENTVHGPEPRELNMEWPEGVPLPVVGELLETYQRNVYEVIGRAFYVGGSAPVLMLLCEPRDVGRAAAPGAVSDTPGAYRGG